MNDSRAVTCGRVLCRRTRANPAKLSLINLTPLLSQALLVCPYPTCGKHYRELGRGMHVLNHNLDYKVLDSVFLGLVMLRMFYRN